nr:polysaccharide lyase family 8 super-sandwich domain-containing protein [uncultured Bacteroides sp.]
MQRKLILLLLLVCTTILSTAQEKETKLAFDNYNRYYGEARRWKDDVKDEAMLKLRNAFAQNPYRHHSLNAGLSAQECLEQLDENGVFSGLKGLENDLRKNNGFQKKSSSLQNNIGLFLVDAFNRIWRIADAYRKGEISEEQALSDKVLKAILHYGSIEAGRPNDGPRFHASCFAMPTAAAGIYFCYLNQMDRAESGQGENLLKEACDMLKVIGLQAWTQPLRHDETDQNVVSIPRFRNHVWWVGGNALAYRSLLPVAAMYRSVPMLDLLSEVCQKGISMTSQTTYSDAFWTEGFTADGAGWGHGMQCLIWGYPIDGTFNALNMLNMLKGTPWAKKLSRENVEAILNFMRGGNWYYYKGYRLPCLDRGSYVYNPTEKSIPYSRMLEGVIANWLDSFTPEEQKELLQLQQETHTNRITMEGYQPGVYSGTRWFFNNDDLIKKTPEYHLTINMASIRCDGLESAASFADAYNFYPTDGMTLFQRSGDEYFRIMGGWDVTASPGVTARRGMDKLTPVENWRGYCSKYNYSAGATDGGVNAVAGYIFEKMNASDKDGVNDRGNSNGLNEILYNFKAYKSYFILDDYMIALGAGITNMRPELEGDIHTTIEQTAWTNEVFTMKQGKKEKLPSGVNALSTSGKFPLWLMQEDKFAYTTLPEFTRKAFVSCETRPTDWIKRNRSNETKKNLPADTKIMRLWIDHGQQPVNDTYGYVVYMGKGTPADKLPFQVLRNDTLIQAVRSVDKKLLEAVFYPGSAVLKAKGLSLSVSAPCAVLMKEEADSYIFSVTDASMNASLKEIELVFNGKTIQVPMPQGMLCGKPAVKRINK